jgi:hypothetical protein
MYTQLITIFFKNHLKPFLLNMKKILAIKWPMSITKMLRYGYRAFKPTAFYSLNIMLIILLSAIWSDLTLNESEVTSSVSTDDIYYLPDMVRMEMAEALDATAACTYDPQTLVIGDGSCSYPPGSQVYKLDEAFEESGSKIVYIKVCGYACCGTVLVNPKAGADCHLLEIAGPRGTGISVTEIGYVTSGMCWINTCAGSDEVMTYCSDGGIESRVTFLGSSDAGDGCSYWYYNFESKVDGCGRAISHMAFALNDFSECCPCTDIELDGPDEKDYGCQTTFDLDAAIQDLIDNGEVYATPFGDGCSANDITYDKASITGDECGYQVVVTYKVEAECGGFDATHEVVFKWKEDLTPPVLSGIPAGGDLGCNPTRPSCDAGVTANDNCDGSVAVTCTPGAITGTACNGYSQTFTYSAMDACGNPVSETVTYTWKEDLTPPVLSGLPAGGDLGCNPTRPSCDTGVTANDNCDGEVAVVCTAGQINIDGCKFSQTFTYSAEDVCGNPVNKMVNYTWIEVDLTCSITVDEDDDCGGTTVTLVASATADCGDLPPGYSFGYEWSTGETTPGITVGAGNYEVTVYIIDPAGNRTECYCTETYTITEECGTSWARARDGSSICNNTFGCASPNWGWTTQLTPGTHEFDLLEGAPSECNGNGSTGDLVGYATVTWDGTSKPVVDLHIDDGEHYATSWHIHVSCNNPLPVARNGKCSAAPGQFGCSDNEVGTDFYDILAGCFQNIDFDGCESIWISIHAVTCDLVCNETLADVSSKNDLFDVDFGNSFKELQNTDIEKTGINLTVFPNPVSRDLYLDIQGLESETLTIQLFDTFGRMVKETKLDYLAKERIHYVLPDQIADGMYYLKLIDKTPVKTIPIMVYQR